MKNLMVKLILNAAAIMLTANLLDGIEVSGWGAVFVTAIVLGIVNAILRPIFLILTLPLNILTFGLLTFVINGVLLLLVSSVVGGFTVTGLGSAIIGSLIISVISTVLSWIVE